MARIRIIVLQYEDSSTAWLVLQSVLARCVLPLTDLQVPEIHTAVPDWIVRGSPISVPSTRHWQWAIGAEAIGPRLNSLVINDVTGIYISQGFLRLD